MDSEFKSTLVVIPARGGSKRIPKKNIKNIYGKPMIFWPLSVLNNFFHLDNIIVSTDSIEIKEKIESTGLRVPFLRPKKLSDDYTTTAEVVKHALDWYEKNVKNVNYVLTVYPTAVMLSEDDIKIAFRELIADRDCDSIMSATHFPFPIQRAIYKGNDGYAKMFEPKNYSKRSQDLVEAFHDAGQFYINRVESIRKDKILTNSNTKLHILNRNRVVDIDTPEDFEIAEEKLFLFNKN